MTFRLVYDDPTEFSKRVPGKMCSDTCSVESPMEKSFESLADYGSATFYVLMEVARSVGTALQAAIATTIVVDQGSDCGAGGIRWSDFKPPQCPL